MIAIAALIIGVVALGLHFRKPRIHLVQVKMPQTEQVIEVEVPSNVQEMQVEVPVIPANTHAICSNCKRMVAQFKVTQNGAVCVNCEIKYGQ